MNATRWVVVGALFGLLVVGGAPAATAELEGTNGCQASGAFREGGFTVDARAVGDALVVVPRSDTVDWQGSVAAPPGAYSGSISVELPKPFGTLEIDSWAGNSQTMSNAGTHEDDLPSLVPAGVEFTVSGSHVDQNGTCSGSVRMEVEGGPFDSPLTAVSLVGTAATGAGLLALLRPLLRPVGKVM